MVSVCLVVTLLFLLIITVVVCVHMRRKSHSLTDGSLTPTAAGGDGGGDVDVQMQDNQSYSTVIPTRRNEAYSSVWQGPLSATNTSPALYETVH